MPHATPHAATASVSTPSVARTVRRRRSRSRLVKAGPPLRGPRARCGRFRFTASRYVPAAVASPAPQWGSPDFGRQPPQRGGYVEIVQLDERRKSVRAEGVRHLGRAGRVGADVSPFRRQDIDGAVPVRLLAAALHSDAALPCGCQAAQHWNLVIVAILQRERGRRLRMVPLDCPDHPEAVWTTASVEFAPGGCQPLLVCLPNRLRHGLGLGGPPDDARDFPRTRRGDFQRVRRRVRVNDATIGKERPPVTGVRRRWAWPCCGSAHSLILWGIASRRSPRTHGWKSIPTPSWSFERETVVLHPAGPCALLSASIRIAVWCSYPSSSNPSRLYWIRPSASRKKVVG